jgi:hypothetical protein
MYTVACLCKFTSTVIVKILTYTVNKKVCNFPVPSRDVTDETLPGREKLNYSRLGRVSSVTSRLGTGKQITLFYSVCTETHLIRFSVIGRG